MILLAVASNAASAAGHLGGGGVDIPVGRILISLLACLMIAALAILLLRQKGGKDIRLTLGRLSPRPGAIEVVEARRLSLHGDVCLVRHDGREYLLLVQGGDSRVLRERDVPASEDAAA